MNEGNETTLDRMEAAQALAIASGHTIDDAVLIVAALENSDVFLVKITARTESINDDH